MPVPASTLDPDSPSGLSAIRSAPLTFGTWGELKRLYKALESEPNPTPAHQAALAALIARLDAAPMTQFRDIPSAQIARGRNTNGLAGFAVQNGRGLFLTNSRNAELQPADFNVPDRLKPTLGKTLALLFGGQQGWKNVVWAGQTLAALQGGGSQIQIVDVADFNDPKLRGAMGGTSLGLVVKDALQSLQSIAASDGVVYAACNRSEGPTFHIISLADPDSPQIVGSLPLPGASFVAVVPNTKLVAVLGSGKLPESFLGSLLSRVGVQVAPGEQRHLHLVDVSRPENPTLVSSLPIAHGDVLAAESNVLYVADNLSRRRYEGNHGVNVVDIQNSASPRVVSRVALGTYYTVKYLASYEGFVYAVPEYYAVKVIDARNPQKPVLGRDLPVSYLQAMTRDGDTLYTGRYSGVQLFHLGEGGGASPTPYGTPPSAQTLGYMKRRAKRYLHTLAKTNPAQYTKVATLFLSEPGSPAWDSAYQWTTTDLVFGGGKRFVQVSHGRGHYKEIRPCGLSIRTREERFPEIWNAHPEDATTLFTAPEAAWPGREMALRILRTGRETIPALGDAALQKTLTAPSLLLVAEGVRQAVAQAEAGKKPSPASAASATANATPKLRTRLMNALAPLAQSDEKWGEEFAGQLLGYLPDLTAVGNVSRRHSGLAASLARVLPGALTGDLLLRLAPLLLQTKRPEVYAPVLDAARREGFSQITNWMLVLDRVGGETERDALLSALAESVQGQELTDAFYEQILLAAPSRGPWLWRLIRVSQVSLEPLRRVWVSLLSDARYESALRNAMASPDALALLGQTGISDDEMAGFLQARPEIVDLLTPDAFARLTQTLPAALTLRLAAAASNDVWPKLRDGWLRNLREGVGLADLWLSAEAAFKSDATGNLESRLLGDGEIAATLLELDDAAQVLEIREPAFGPILAQYFARYEDRIAKNDALFLLAATHPLPDVRTPALALLPERTINLPLALGLLESEVPASIGAGRTWFDKAANDITLLDRALALCDSPAASVRAIGRDFATAHRDALPLPDFSAALTEHNDPIMQAFVARLLNNEPAPQFDREILRTRYQSRRAKEVVKVRQEVQKNGGSVDVETLLALARDPSTPRDAEWALTQLVRRALAGETIDGLVLDK